MVVAETAAPDVVSFCDDENLEFARVEQIEGDPVTGIACLAELADAESEQAAGDRALDAHSCSDE